MVDTRVDSVKKTIFYALNDAAQNVGKNSTLEHHNEQCNPLLAATNIYQIYERMYIFCEN